MPELLSVQHGHFLVAVQLFDQQLFEMSPMEVQATDPSHRLLLETVAGSFSRSNQTKEACKGTTMGMFLGICNIDDWNNVQNDIGDAPTVFTMHEADGGSAACRVSYLFGLKGPCFSVNTACSSAIVALDAACQNLQLATCSQNLMSAVCLQLHARNGPRWTVQNLRLVRLDLVALLHCTCYIAPIILLPAVVS